MSMATKEFQEIPGKDNYADSLEEVARMQHIPTFTPESEEKTHILIELIRKIPFLEDFLRDSDESGEFISALLEAKGNETPSPSLTEATTGFHYAHMGLAIVNFIRIPLMYMAAWILGKELPFKLTRMGKLVYSAVLLALAVTTVIIPGLATVMGIAASGLGLGLSLYTLGNYFYQRSQLKKEIAGYDRAIALEDGLLKEIKEQSAQNGSDLQQAIKNGDKANIERLLGSIQRMKGVYDHTIKRQQTFHNDRFLLQQKLEKFNTTTLTDRAVGFALTFGLLTGLTLGLFFPPVGLGLAAASTILSVAYFTKRFVIPFIANKVQQWKEKRAEKSVETAGEGKEPQESLEVANEFTAQHTVASPAIRVHESTADTMIKLGEQGPPVKQRSSSVISDDSDDEDFSDVRSVTPPPIEPDELEEGEGERERSGEEQVEQPEETESEGEGVGLHK